MSETLTRPLMGVREYTVDDDGFLGSLTGRGGRWEPDAVQKARCERGYTTPPGYQAVGNYHPGYAYYDAATGKRVEEPAYELHDAPNFDCGCGWHAFYDLGLARAYGNGAFWENCRAVVSAWGEVVLCKHGFRSEYMQVEAIVVGQRTAAFVGYDVDLMDAWRALAERYAVPLIEESEIEEFCRGRGEVLEGRDLMEEAREQSREELRAIVHDLYKGLAKIAQTSERTGGKPSNFQEAIERKRNKPAFWRDAAGGDVHGG